MERISHNFFHWLVVVLIRALSFLVFTLICTYLAVIGFLISQKAIQSFFPPILNEKIIYYSSSLPYFTPIQKFIFSLVNNWFNNGSTWWAMTIGIPLIMTALSIFLINFFNLYFSIFDSFYNKTRCFFCR